MPSFLSLNAENNAKLPGQFFATHSFRTLRYLFGISLASGRMLTFLGSPYWWGVEAFEPHYGKKSRKCPKPFSPE